jgi:hypothetical protein
MDGSKGLQIAGTRTGNNVRLETIVYLRAQRLPQNAILISSSPLLQPAFCRSLVLSRCPHFTHVTQDMTFAPHPAVELASRLIDRCIVECILDGAE